MTVGGAVGLAGTRGYLPPKHCDGKRGVKSDVYSYGIVCHLIIIVIYDVYTMQVCLETFTGLLVYEKNASW